MDNKSAELAKNVKKILPSFKYYQSSKNSMHKATFLTRVSDPVANEGYPTFEIQNKTPPKKPLK